MADGGGGFDPSLLLFGPQYLQIQRQQALAEKLMGAQPVPYEIGGYPTGPGAFLASGLSNVLGAYEGRQADKGLANLYGQSGLLGGPRSFRPANANAPSVNTGYGTVPVPSATANPMNWQQSQQQPDLWVQAKIIGVKYGPEAAQAYIASNGDMDAVKRALSVKSLPPAPKDYGYIPDPKDPSQWTLAGVPVKEEIGGGGQPPHMGYVAPPPLGTNVLGTPSDSAYANVESRNNPQAESPASARGTMQTMPGTLASPGFGVTPARDNSPAEQTRVGQDYHAAMLNRYHGDQVLAAVAYNWGPGNTDKWVASGADFSKLPDETQKFLGRLAVANRSQGAPQAGAPSTAQAPQPQQAPPGTPPSAAPPQQQAPHILTEQEKQAYTATQKAQSDAENALPHVRANTQQLLQELDDLEKTSAAIPASLGGKPLEGAYWADQNFPGATPYGGKLATAIQRWEQLGNSKALANISQIAQSGVGRMDIPIVNAIKQASIAPWTLTGQGRMDLLHQLRAMVINNQTVTENTARGFHGQAPLPMQSGFPTPAPQAPKTQQFDESGKTVYRDKNGNMARRQNGQWVEVAH